MVAIETGSTADVDAVVDHWVALAESQRTFGSHLLAAPNREAVRDAVARRAIAGELLVARASEVETASSQSSGHGQGGSETGEREIVGFVTFGVETGSFDVDVTRGIVQNVFVAPDYRGEGIGSDLLQAAEDRLADAGADIVALDVMADNADARRFYRQHGFTLHRVEMEKSVESDTLTKE